MPLFNAPTDQKELARTGQPEAIAAVVNHAIQSQGITAKAVLKDGSLLLLLESATVPDPTALVPFIKNGLTELGIESVPTLKIYGRKIGDRLPAWQEEIDIEPPESAFATDEDMFATDEDMFAEDEDVLADDEDMLAEDEDMLADDEDLLPDEENLMANDDLEGPDEDESAEYLDDEDEDEDEDEEIASGKPQGKKWYQNKVLLIVPLVVLILFLGGGAAYWFLMRGQETTTPASDPADPAASAPAPTPDPAAEAPAPTPDPAAEAPAPAPDPAVEAYREAVRLAEEAANQSQTAQTQAEWNQIAVLWQEASDLMGQIPENSPNYPAAEPRVGQYQQNADSARQRAANALE
ncbi:hypothetical protein J0895_22630 [Phormidium pseudopriestleyi FRX01]|uniref:Uncharacterized protein n=1 Tax=Phormidium pseudopriestleyi FRX01 TaxID=1759528 RepID=A0ABS3FXG9_9CYAN|nr:hypothetical protein [Phormidium pseudopriestleyi]MBO0351825.1 hypothetical protein [Phormidium pseudopriestleyi FRX01]